MPAFFLPQASVVAVPLRKSRSQLQRLTPQLFSFPQSASPQTAATAATLQTVRRAVSVIMLDQTQLLVLDLGPSDATRPLLVRPNPIHGALPMMGPSDAKPICNCWPCCVIRLDRDCGLGAPFSTEQMRLVRFRPRLRSATDLPTLLRTCICLRALLRTRPQWRTLLRFGPPLRNSPLFLFFFRLRSSNF